MDKIEKIIKRLNKPQRRREKEIKYFCSLRWYKTYWK